MAVFVVFPHLHSGRAASVSIPAIADTALFAPQPDNNLGGMSFVPVGVTYLGDATRGLFKFDVAGNVPAGATIQSVEMTIPVVFANIGSPFDFDLHRVWVEWGEGDNVGEPDASGHVGRPADTDEASWNHRMAPATAWAAGGGMAGTDFASDASASATIGGEGSYLFSSATMVADVQAWLDYPDANFGWLLQLQNESALGANGSARRFGSRENTGNEPVLAIAFTLPPPILRGVQVVGGQFTFQFQGWAGTTYQAQRRLRLGEGEWTTITNVPLLGTTGPVIIFDPLSSGARFYQVLLSP